MIELGQFIKQKREASGLSQKKLGEAVGISDAEVCKIENGERQTPNWDSLCKISKALNIHPFEILHNAGYISEDDLKPYLAPISGLEDLTNSELHYVQLFTDFIRSQRNTTESN
jgi:transcriptional regulator with XRE-family HTH domain